MTLAPACPGQLETKGHTMPRLTDNAKIVTD